ncbi:RNA-binding domain-containing protein [Backusella circina FSU 941]|nr:RNA-binding domain-containing protein [Backusella circina FSU 941]
MADYDRRSNSPTNKEDTPTKEEVRSPAGGSGRSRSRSSSRSPKRESPRRSRSPSPRRSSSRRRSPERRSRRRSRSRSRSRDRRRSNSPRRRSRSPRRQQSRQEANKEFHGTRDEPEVSNILGVFGLSLRTREVDLEDVFREHGSLEKVTIVYDHRSNRSRGFGFVYFKDQNEAARAREALNGMDIDGRKIRVDYSVTHRPHTPTPGEYMGERRNYDRDRRSHRSDRRRRSRSRSRDRRRRYYRSRSRSRSWSR